MSYATRDDIEAQFGAVNVATWADLDEDSDAGKITARITRALEAADQQIDDALRGGPYEVPITAAGAVVTLRDIATRLAAVWLYESRGVQESDDNGRPIHRLSWHRQEAERQLTRIRAGALVLDAPLARSDVSSAPQIAGD